MKIIFEYKAFEEFNEWAAVDKKIYDKIVELIKDIKRSPYSGKGKAEPLKYSFSYRIFNSSKKRSY
jgi:toxin YoeB